MATQTATRPLPEKFYAILEEEVKLSEEIVSLLVQERKALVDMDMSVLISLSRKKENHVTRLQGLDSLLQEMARNFCESPSGKIIKLSALMPLLAKDEATRLNDYREKLAVLREQILSKNVVNRGFAQETKKFLNDAISTITHLVAEKPTYARTKGMSKPSVNQPSFISREV